MYVPKIGPSGGKEVQTTSRPAGQVWKKTEMVVKQDFDNAVSKKVKKMNVKNEIPNPEEAETTENVAFKFFEKINKASR